MEKCLADSLQDISRQTHDDYGISTHYVPSLSRRIYIEAPGIVEIQEIMKFSTYGHLISRATRISDDDSRNFLHSSSIPDLPCPGTWVRIIQPGIYKGDLAVVLLSREGSDIVMIAIVPRFNDSKNKKRRGGNRPAPALLDPKFVAKFPSSKNNIHFIQSRTFHPNGLEFLEAPITHALKIEPRPSEAELNLFQSSFGQVDKKYEAELLIQRAVNSAFRNESRRLWRMGDRVRIIGGTFVGTLCSIQEIDELNRSIVVDLPDLTRADVEMEDLERHFLIGDQVRVAFGINKGRTGSIIKIIEDIGTIVEGTANQLFEVSYPSIFLHLFIILPSSMRYYFILKAIL
jgi:ribosomal protein L24